MSKYSGTGLVVAALMLFVGCSQPTTPPEIAGTIYYGGEILTMNGDEPTYAEAVAARDGKIVFVGSKAQALEMKGDSTKINELGGKAMLPGFIDPHGHFMFALNMVNQVNVANPPVGSCVDIPSTIKVLKNSRRIETSLKADGSSDGATTKMASRKAAISPRRTSTHIFQTTK